MPDRAMPLIDFKLSLLSGQYDVNKTEEKRAYIAAALKVIAEAESASVKEDLLKIVRDQDGHAPTRRFKRDLEKRARCSRGSETRIRAQTGRRLRPRRESSRFILASVLFHAKYAKNFDISSVSFDNIVHNRIADYIKNQQNKGETVRAERAF